MPLNNSSYTGTYSFLTPAVFWLVNSTKPSFILEHQADFLPAVDNFQFFYGVVNFFEAAISSSLAFLEVSAAGHDFTPSMTVQNKVYLTVADWMVYIKSWCAGRCPRTEGELLSGTQLPSVRELTASTRFTVWLLDTSATVLPSTAAMQLVPSRRQSVRVTVGKSSLARCTVREISC